MAKPQRLHTRLAPFLALLTVLALVASLPWTAGFLTGETAQRRPAQVAGGPAGMEQGLGAANLFRPGTYHPWQELPLVERQQRCWPVVRRLSEHEGMDPALVMAVVHVESRFDPCAQSQRGAQGLMQLTPATAQHLGLRDPADPEANLRAGIRYLSSLKKTFQNDVRLTLAAYNAGPTTVQQAGKRVFNIEETRDFVTQVLAKADHYRAQPPTSVIR